MANRKISELPAKATPATTDIVPIVDPNESDDEDKNKRTTVGGIRGDIPSPSGSVALPSQKGIAGASDDYSRGDHQHAFRAPLWTSGEARTAGDIVRSGDGHLYVVESTIVAGSAGSTVDPDEASSALYHLLDGYSGVWSSVFDYAKGNYVDVGLGDEQKWYIARQYVPRGQAEPANNDKWILFIGGRESVDLSTVTAALGLPAEAAANRGYKVVRGSVDSGDGAYTLVADTAGTGGTAPTLDNVTAALGLPAEATANRGYKVVRGSVDSGDGAYTLVEDTAADFEPTQSNLYDSVKEIIVGGTDDDSAHTITLPAAGGGGDGQQTARNTESIEALRQRTGDIEEQSITRSYQLSAVATQGGIEEVSSKPADASEASTHYGAADGTNTLSVSAAEAESGIEFIFRIRDGSSLTDYNFDGLSYHDWTNLELVGSGGGWQYWYIPVAPTLAETPVAFTIKMQVLTSVRYRWDGDLTKRAIDKALGSDVDARLDRIEDRTHDISGHGGRSWSNTVVASQGGMREVADLSSYSDANEAAAAFTNDGVNTLNIGRNDDSEVLYRIPETADSTNYRIGIPNGVSLSDITDYGVKSPWRYFGTQITNNTDTQITATFQHNASDYVWEGLIKPDKIIGSKADNTTDYLRRDGTWQTPPSGGGSGGTAPTLTNVTDALGLPAESEGNRRTILGRGDVDTGGGTYVLYLPESIVDELAIQRALGLPAATRKNRGFLVGRAEAPNELGMEEGYALYNPADLVASGLSWSRLSPDATTPAAPSSGTEASKSGKRSYGATTPMEIFVTTAKPETPSRRNPFLSPTFTLDGSFAGEPFMTLNRLLPIVNSSGDRLLLNGTLVSIYVAHVKNYSESVAKVTDYTVMLFGNSWILVDTATLTGDVIPGQNDSTTAPVEADIERWNDTDTYAADAFAIHEGTLYRSLQDNNTNNTPEYRLDIVSAWWSPVGYQDATLIDAALGTPSGENDPSVHTWLNHLRNGGEIVPGTITRPSGHELPAVIDFNYGSATVVPLALLKPLDFDPRPEIVGLELKCELTTSDDTNPEFVLDLRTDNNGVPQDQASTRITVEPNGAYIYHQIEILPEWDGTGNLIVTLEVIDPDRDMAGTAHLDFRDILGFTGTSPAARLIAQIADRLITTTQEDSDMGLTQDEVISLINQLVPPAQRPLAPTSHGGQLVAANDDGTALTYIEAAALADDVTAEWAQPGKESPEGGGLVTGASTDVLNVHDGVYLEADSHESFGAVNIIAVADSRSPRRHPMGICLTSAAHADVTGIQVRTQGPIIGLPFHVPGAYNLALPYPVYWHRDGVTVGDQTTHWSVVPDDDLPPIGVLNRLAGTPLDVSNPYIATAEAVVDFSILPIWRPAE